MGLVCSRECEIDDSSYERDNKNSKEKSSFL